MSFPSGGSGYPQQGAAPQQQQQGPGSGGFQQQQTFPQQPYQQRGTSATTPQNIGIFLALAVTLLGVVNYLVSFSDEAAVVDEAVRLLLIGGLLAALRALPNGPRVVPFAALASVVGALYTILAVVRVPEVPGIVTVVLILGILQMLVAIAALLLDYGVITLPAGGQQSPYGYPYGQAGVYAPQSGPFHQQTQYGPPGTPGAQPGQHGQAGHPGQGQPMHGGQPSQQPTQYASQQGQFFPPQSQEAGEKGSSGGTGDSGSTGSR